MRKVLTAMSGMAVAACLTLGMATSADAAPLSALPTLQVDQTSLVQNAHCRRYYHCHRRCWRRHGHYHCRKRCHRC